MAQGFIDHCSIRVRIFLDSTGQKAKARGPAIEFENGSMQMKAVPPDATLLGVYSITGSYYPHCAGELVGGRPAVEEWFDKLRAKGFCVERVG